MKKENQKRINKAPAYITLSLLNFTLVQSPCTCIQTVFGSFMKNRGTSSKPHLRLRYRIDNFTIALITPYQEQTIWRKTITNGCGK